MFVVVIVKFGCKVTSFYSNIKHFDDFFIVFADLCKS